MTSLPLGSEFRVNTFTTGYQSLPDIAMDDDGGFIVSWESSGQDGDSSGIYAQRYDEFGVAIGPEFKVNTFTTVDQSDSSVAMDDEGNFVVTWTSYGQDGDFEGIYAQKYNSAGASVGSEFRVNTFTTDSQLSSSVAMDDEGNFVVAWASDGQDGDSYGIYAQRYNSAGAALGGEFRVNTTTVDDQFRPEVAMADNGNFVAIWESDDGSSQDIYAQLYNSSGAAIGSEVLVNTFTTDSQFLASVDMDADGDYVVTWTSASQPGDGDYGVYAQRFNSDGTKEGGEFRVNSFTTGVQAFSSVAMDDDGDFVITWQSGYLGYPGFQDGDLGGVYAQRYSADGTAIGSEFKVSTFTTNTQGRPVVAADADGDFAIAWASAVQDSDASSGIYAQRYSLPSEVSFSDATYQVNEDGAPVGTEVTLTRTHDKVAAEVQVNITGGTATAGDDYTGTSFPLTVSFAAGEDSATVVIPIVQDGISEDTETITLGLTATGDTLLGTQSTTVLEILDNDTGTNGDDKLKGTIGDDLLLGLEGDDKLAGDDGDDKLKGGDGDDVLRGGKGDDRLSGGKGDDKLLGGDGDDVLKGGADDDVLKGGKGDDKLVGNGGNDVMSGGKGRDVFDKLSSKGFALIKDFENGDDQLGLSGKVKFGDLDIDQDGKSTIISLDGDILAELKGVKVNQINAADFV